ncbi:MAG: indole-3-glycerol phosphate synthase TrpC [Peptococcaceae bacterium]|nr:indole-3-glycerol phosphate synthase TrpC [Peptococcaceae bacterium]
MILDIIVEHKKKEVALFRKNIDLIEFKSRAEAITSVRSLKSAMTNSKRPTLLAEVKKASPSKGIIREKFNVHEIAKTYTNNGADGISVLTDEKFFQGSPEYLLKVREATLLPILRKDFIIDTAQIYQSRILGADAILLICAILSLNQLKEFKEIAEGLGLECLVEVHNEQEMDMAMEVNADLIGINNRNLNNFQVDIDTSFNLSKRISDPSVTLISESGISSRQVMKALYDGGVDGVLVGEALMSAADLGSKVREMSGREDRDIK